MAKLSLGIRLRGLRAAIFTREHNRGTGYERDEQQSANTVHDLLQADWQPL
ncbi:MAG: hypothetical protein ABSF72_06145 [Candidatus Sulfotelmatobacter sp.]